MTAPATGAPDWQTLTSLYSAPLFDGNVIVPAGTTTSLGQWNTSSYPAVHISISPNLNGGTLTVFSGETISNVPDDIVGQWVVRPETRIEVTVPLPRTQMNISLTAQAGADWNFNVRVALTTVAADHHHYYGTASMIAASNVAIAAGGSQTYFPSTLLPGPAHIWILNAVPANQLNFDVISRNSDGTATVYIAQFRSSAVETHQSLVIPDRIFQVNVFNAGAGANTYYFSLCTAGMLA